MTWSGLTGWMKPAELAEWEQGEDDPGSIFPPPRSLLATPSERPPGAFVSLSRLCGLLVEPVAGMVLARKGTATPRRMKPLGAWGGIQMLGTCLRSSHWPR